MSGGGSSEPRLGAILPRPVVAVEAFDDLPGAPLFAEEEAVVERAVDKRRREFTTARDCARRALAALGRSPQAIPRGARGEPRWPAGVVGSITHCAGYRACALADAGDVLTIGIDAEPHDRLPDGVLRLIARPEELRPLRELAERAPDVHWDRLLFCAKESVYKAWFPLARRWLGFGDAVVSIDPDERTFSARLLVPGPSHEGGELRGFVGRFAVTGGLVVTAIAPARARETYKRT